MTVRELIEHLSLFNPDARVAIDAHSPGEPMAEPIGLCRYIPTHGKEVIETQRSDARREDYKR